MFCKKVWIARYSTNSEILRKKPELRNVNSKLQEIKSELWDKKSVVFYCPMMEMGFYIYIYLIWHILI